MKEGLQASVPEELEKHMILNSNRLRTFEDARLEIVTYVEAKISSQVTQDLEDTLIPWMLTRSILLHLEKGKRH